MEKTCKICGQTKLHDKAQRPSSKASGFVGRVCWACYLSADAAVSNTIRRATPEGRAAHNAATYAWAKRYPGKNAALRMKRHAAKLQRTPPWADFIAIAKVYIRAAQQGLTVDHVIPLQGKLVSGLHVENNLQLLTKSENSKKGNRVLDV